MKRTWTRTVQQERSSPRSLCWWSKCCGWSAAGLGWRPSGVVLNPCGGWPKGQEEGGVGGRLLASECQGVLVSRDAQSVLVGLQASECSQLAGDVQRLRWIAGERKWPGQPFGRKCAEWSGGVCKTVNAAWAGSCLELGRMVRWGCRR
jgi:hypothetical protein